MFESRGGLWFVQAARMSSVTAYFGEQRKEAEGRDSGVLLSLVTFFLSKQKKVTRREGERERLL